MIVKKLLNNLLNSINSSSNREIPFIVLVIGQKCTLKCRDCVNFSPYLPQTVYSFKEIKSDLLALKTIAHIDMLQLQGGEPLLFPELAELIMFIKEIGIKNQFIATNGTLLMKKEIINVLRDAGVSVRISNYGIRRQKANLLVKQCQREGISYEIYNFANNDGYWRNFGDIEIQRNNNDVKVRDIFRNCPFNGCLTLENGILARCSRAPQAHKVQRFIPRERDLLNIRQTKNLRNILINYIRNKDFMEACRYCQGGIGEKITPAVQLTKRKVPI